MTFPEMPDEPGLPRKNWRRSLAKLCFALERFKPLAKWAGMALLMLAAMRSVARYALPGEPPAQTPKTFLKEFRDSHPGSEETAWWNPQSSFANPALETVGPVTEPDHSPPVHSVVPIDRSVQLSSSSLTASNAGGLDPIGTGSSQPEPVYAVLGLSRTNPVGSRAGSGMDDDGSDLHFSLSGSLSPIPTYNFASESVALSTVPEPAAGAIMVAGLAVLALRRRRFQEACRLI